MTFKIALAAFIFVLAGSTLGAAPVEAKSVQQSQSITGWFDYYYGGNNGGHPDNPTGFYNGYDYLMWGLALVDPNITVTYSAVLTDVATGAVINDGATVSVGAQVKVTPTPHASSDIYWFGTGYGMDSPYGEWGTAAPAITCNVKDYTNESIQESYCLYEEPIFPDACTYYGYCETYCAAWGPRYQRSVYIPLVVEPPTKTITTSSNLSCGAVAADGSKTCTVTAPGASSATVTFAATSGKMYHRISGDNIRGGPYITCGGNNVPLAWHGGPETPTTPHNTFIVNVAQKDIAFSFTAVQLNQPPNAPVIDGPVTRNVSESGTYGFTATDPNGDTLRYLVDWNNDSIGDQYLPASGYTGSGSRQAFPNSWSGAGSKTFKALAQDSQGASSGWTSYSVTVNAPPACSDGLENDGDGLVDYPADPGCSSGSDTDEYNPPAPTADLTASPTSVVTGSASTLTWTSANAASCSGTGFNTGGATSGSVSTGALTINSNYQVTCGSASDTASVTVTNPTIDVTATPDRVNPGSSVNISWTSSQCTVVAVTRDGAAFSSGVTGTNVPAANITKQTTFRAVCDAGTTQDTVIVNIVPGFEEF